MGSSGTSLSAAVALSFHCCGSVGSHFVTNYETCMRDFLESHKCTTLRSADVPIIREESVLNLSFNRRSSEMRVLGLLLTASLWALIAKADQPVEFESIVTDGSSVFQNIIVGTGNTFEETNTAVGRSEEHTSELQSRGHLVCRLLLEKKKKKNIQTKKNKIK